MFRKKETKETTYSGLTEFDESVLFLTRPYIKITLVCLLLSFYCILNTGGDYDSRSFVLSVITFTMNSIFIVILYFKARRIRTKGKGRKLKKPYKT